jgi:small subunit ribosomal protein S9
MAVQYYEGIGRRKESTARVRLMNGSGEITVNQKPGTQFFSRPGDLDDIWAPFAAVGQDKSGYDVTVMVNGGGVTGQTVAVQLGLSRALAKMNPDLRLTLRQGGFLTRDARTKERKKPGLKRARKAPTYTKR